MKPPKVCPGCGTPHRKRTIYCRAECWYKSDGIRRPKPPGHGAAVSRANKGKPKPWNRGEKNPNFGNKAQGKPAARERFLRGIELRGPTATDESRRRHSELMLGPTNKMRGRRHTEETKRRVSEVKRQQYADGVIKLGGHKISRPEKAIGAWLAANSYDYVPQFHINGVRFNYDFYIPSLNLILEFNGDYWHANPEIHLPGTLLTFVHGGAKPVEAIWARDAARKLAAETHGYRFECIWEREFKKLGMASVAEVLRRYGAAPLAADQEKEAV